MDIFKSLTSSFRAINRMGQNESSQIVPESSLESSLGKVFNPDDVRLTDDDEDTISVSQNAPATLEPELPQHPAIHESRKEERRGTKREKKRRSRLESPSQLAEDIQIGDENLEEDAGNDELATGQERFDANYERNGSESSPKDNIAYPPLNSKSEQETSQKEIQTESQEPNHKSDEVESVMKQLQSKSKLATSRVLCPLANMYDCDKTFASERIAERHSQIHLQQTGSECPVCSKTYARGDKLRTHMLGHPRSEIATATARLRSRQLHEEAALGADNATQGEDDNDMGEAEEAQMQINSGNNSPEELEGDLTLLQKDSGAEDNHNQSSATASTSHPQLIDEEQTLELVQETPRPKSRLKRKRDMQSATKLSERRAESPQKRRRRQSLSPPESVASHEEIPVKDILQNVNKSIPTPIPQITKIKSARTGSLDNFAMRWTPGSQLHHPIHNPRSPRIEPTAHTEVSMAQTSHAGPSARQRAKNQQDRPTRHGDDLVVEDTPLAGKAQNIVFTSPKGKRKAVTGMTYSSPPKSATGAVDNGHDSDALEPIGMATSVARRGASTTANRKRPRPASDDVEDNGGKDASTQNRGRNSTGTFLCQECGKSFTNKDALRKHEKRPGVHSTNYICEDCSQPFTSLTNLKAHQQGAGHGDGTGEQGRKGHFDNHEVRKLQNWRRHFCEENSINISTFNQMMTDSCRRERSFQWPYRFVSRVDFLKEYYDVLPDRNRRSMHRYREREFQNVPENQEWTEEDDEELLRLIQEHGQKWVEIGQLMTRTQDSVSQRWRFKLKYQGAVNHGEWINSETKKLKDVVAQVKRESGLPMNADVDLRFSWESVSMKMKGKRTAQQCSNKWRIMHQKRRGNTFYKPDDGDQKSGGAPKTKTPSKMEQRLANQDLSSGQRLTSSKRKIISDERVNESDDVDSTNRKNGMGGEGRSDSEDEQGSQEVGSDSEPADIETPVPRRNPLSSKTPGTGKGLSQAFAQTQANTSALRAPNSTHNLHTQTEMPTPGVMIQHRPDSSPWQAINSNALGSIGNNQLDEDTVMAEPRSSGDEQSRASSAEVPPSRRAVSSSTSAAGSEATEDEESGEEDEEDEEGEKANGIEKDVRRRAAPKFVSKSEASEVSESEREESEDQTDDDDEDGTQSADDSDSEAEATGSEATNNENNFRKTRESFMQSLKSSKNSRPPLLKPGKSSAQQGRVKRVDLTASYRGDATAMDDDSDSDSDEGDIPYQSTR